MRSAVLLALVALALPACADARLVPHRGMAGIALGMAPSKVRAVLGRPLAVIHRKNEFGPYTVFVYPRVSVSFQGNSTVTNLRTFSRAERTRNGAGIGTTERELRRKVRGLRCKTEFGFRHCWLGAFRPGRRVTNFMIARGRVTRIEIGYVID